MGFFSMLRPHDCPHLSSYKYHIVKVISICKIILWTVISCMCDWCKKLICLLWDKGHSIACYFKGEFSLSKIVLFYHLPYRGSIHRKIKKHIENDACTVFLRSFHTKLDLLSLHWYLKFYWNYLITRGTGSAMFSCNTKNLIKQQKFVPTYTW